MKLTVVRHGETLENQKRIIQGHNHGTLSKEGIAQAKQRAVALRGKVFDLILSSDLDRCKDTADIIREFHPDVSIHVTSDLREINYSTYQGKPSNSLDWHALEGTALTKKAPGGESWTDLSGRVTRCLNNTFIDNPDKNILVVTHGGPMRIIRAALANTALESLIANPIPNCASWEFEMTQPVDPEMQITMLAPAEI